VVSNLFVLSGRVLHGETSGQSFMLATLQPRLAVPMIRDTISRAIGQLFRKRSRP
jgi:hypothetical protein